MLRLGEADTLVCILWSVVGCIVAISTSIIIGNYTNVNCSNPLIWLSSAALPCGLDVVDGVRSLISKWIVTEGCRTLTPITQLTCTYYICGMNCRLWIGIHSQRTKRYITCSFIVLYRWTNANKTLAIPAILNFNFLFSSPALCTYRSSPALCTYRMTLYTFSLPGIPNIVPQNSLYENATIAEFFSHWLVHCIHATLRTHRSFYIIC